MADRAELLKRLALARNAKRRIYAEKKKPLQAPKSKPEGGQTPLISNPERELASRVAKKAMICGWEKAIAIHAVEEGVIPHRIEQILDDALKYNDKADPSGRIEELEDWKREKMTGSVLQPSRRAY